MASKHGDKVAGLLLAAGASTRMGHPKLLLPVEGSLNPKVRLVVNPEYTSGMSTSIRAGLPEVEKGYDHVMIVLADMPFVKADAINLLMYRYLSSGCVMGAVRVRGRRSHPVIFGRKLYPALMKLSGDAGARHLFQAPEKNFCLVDLGDAYDDQDIDTPEDYARLQERTSVT
jgi:molybdenum cofactor cytidylyltransferase